MVLGHQPAIMDITEDTIPELQPIFSFLNSHSNKLYQEGYFLKLDDQNTRMHNLAPATASSIPLHQVPPATQAAPHSTIQLFTRAKTSS